ncbi:hypothetical protein NDA16_004977 [Ustilago loliicola]|nr:hypothetical protein NDA16_004977 [Ustilago loliicola]
MSLKNAQLFFFTFAAITLACWTTASTAYTANKGPFATHFYDCCRAAFSYDHPKAHTYAPVDACQKDGITLLPENATGKNGCDGGDQFACSCMQPWVDSVDPELAYGFGAYNVPANGNIESACYLVEFLPQDPTGKTMKVRKMILQNINTSGGIGQGSWDMMLAGGGVGEYNKGCSNQWGTDWGKQNGGVGTQESCCGLPESLRSSCLFRFTVFGDNPGLASTPQRVRCPVGIIDRSGSQRADDAQILPYNGKTDQTGHPAPDKYQRNRSICQNVDPLGIVSSVCGGTPAGRLPKGSGMVRQDNPAAVVPGGGSSASQPESYGAAPDQGSAYAGAGSGGDGLGEEPPTSYGRDGGAGNPTKQGLGGAGVGTGIPVSQQSPGDQGLSGGQPTPDPQPLDQQTQAEGYGAGLPLGQGPPDVAQGQQVAKQPGSAGATGQGSFAKPAGLAGHRRSMCRNKRSL